MRPSDRGPIPEHLGRLDTAIGSVALDELELARLAEDPDEAELERLAGILRNDGLGVCRICFCTDVTACDPPCSWVEGDLCSTCEPVADLAASLGAIAIVPTNELEGRLRRRYGLPEKP